jgi:hypothetical protein
MTRAEEIGKLLAQKRQIDTVPELSFTLRLRWLSASVELLLLTELERQGENANEIG